MLDTPPYEPGSSRAFIAAAGLAVGLLTGFAAGYVTSQRNQAAALSASADLAEQRSAPPGAAEDPAHSYTETPVAEAPAEVAAAEVVPPPAPERVTAAPLTSRAPPPAPRRTGTVVVVSRPPGAQVFLDDRLVGTTPLSLDGVPAGTHGVRIALPDYRRWATAVTVTGDSSVRVAASLER